MKRSLFSQPRTFVLTFAALLPLVAGCDLLSSEGDARIQVQLTDALCCCRSNKEQPKPKNREDPVKILHAVKHFDTDIFRKKTGMQLISQ